MMDSDIFDVLPFVHVLQIKSYFLTAERVA